MSQRRKIWSLRHLDLFASMTAREIEEMSAALDERDVPAGVDLLCGSPGGQIYLIKEGAVRISAGEERDEVTLCLLGPGRVFGVSSVVGDDAPAIHATTVAPTFICAAGWSRMATRLARHPLVLLRMTGTLARQVVEIERWRERLRAQSPRGRLLCLLDELAGEFGEPIPGGARIPYRLTRVDLARMIGASRETVSRVMADLERAGRVWSQDGLLIVGPGLSESSSAACLRNRAPRER